MSVFSKVVVTTTQARPVERLITGSRPGKALARRFVAGDTLDEAVAVARELNSNGSLVSLDLLGEEVHDRDSAVSARDEYLASLERIADEQLMSNISVKLTQLGLTIDEGLAVELLDSLAARADQIGTTVTIDMEDSRFTDATVRIYEEAQGLHGNLGVALQAYMRRTPADLERLMPLGGHLRLCKGAYVEDADLALTTKAEVDAAFAAQLRSLMSFESVKPAVATHDLELVGLTRELAQNRDHDFEFQMLYGVRTGLQSELVAEGFTLRVYLPFGSQWYPYLTRRLAERPANAWFFARSVFGS
ncbi:MAG TPA: proline dehydrogenase family protein [Acidimicrobiia bacterium]|nr:proline dehydrogenase family protein [Acidimicrobiia bacterium]